MDVFGTEMRKSNIKELVQSSGLENIEMVINIKEKMNSTRK